MNIRLIILLLVLLISCADEKIIYDVPATDPDNGGLILPQGFGALVVADSVGPEDTWLSTAMETFTLSSELIQGTREIWRLETPTEMARQTYSKGLETTRMTDGLQRK